MLSVVCLIRLIGGESGVPLHDMSPQSTPTSAGSQGEDHPGRGSGQNIPAIQGQQCQIPSTGCRLATDASIWIRRGLFLNRIQN